MIPLLIAFLIRKIKNNSFEIRSLGVQKKLSMKLIIIPVLLIVFMSFAIEDKSIKQLDYNVIRNNDIIGSIQVSYTAKNDSIIYYLDSHINVKCLFKRDSRFGIFR